MESGLQHCSSTLFSAFALALCIESAAAQVPLSGALSDATTGPLLSGVVYHATGNPYVPAGATLTAQPGAIVKFVSGGARFSIEGTLLAQGTALQPVIFTEIRDDSAGGDTNGNGPSVGAAGYWRGLRFEDGADGSVLQHIGVRFGGFGYASGIELVQADVTLSGCAVEDCAYAGLDLLDVTLGATVSGCHFQGNGLQAVRNVPLQAVPGFASNSAAGNGGNYMQVSAGTPVTDLRIAKESCLGGALVLASNVTVPAGLTLTLGPGVVWKMAAGGARITVEGKLLTDGRMEEPVVLTSFADDSWAGDTNNDGPSSGAPGAWRGLWFAPTAAASSLLQTVVRYGGYGFAPGVMLDGAAIVLANVSILDCAFVGLELGDDTVGTSVVRCRFEHNGTYAVNGVPLQAVPGFADNRAEHNGGDYMRVTVAVPDSDMTILPQACLEGALVLAGNAAVPAGVTLTVESGVVLKFASGGALFDVQGTLIVRGSAAAPVVLTAFADDDWGGDTNGDGPSVGAPGAWRGVRFGDTASASSLTQALVRFGGWGYHPGIWFDRGAIALTDSTVADCAFVGLDLGDDTVGAVVARCRFERNGTTAIAGVPFQAVGGFADNSAQQNGGNYLLVSDGTPTADLFVEARSCLEGALVFQGSVHVPKGLRVTLGPGFAAKLGNQGALIDVDGALDVLGTAAEPVVFTSFDDDSIAGDTNNNGSSTPAPGWWRGALFRAGADPAMVEHLVLRYTGYGYHPAFLCDSPALTAHAVRVDHAAFTGFQVSALAGAAEGWVAFGCGDRGIDLRGGTFDLRQASAVRNGHGIERRAAYAGGVSDTIAWNNVIADYVGFAAGQLRYSDGSAALAGENGNIFEDPLFEGELAGDLHLQRESPCIDAGNPASPPDPDATRADMGAYPYDHCAPLAYCTAKLNSCGTAPYLEASGVPSATAGAGFVVRARLAKGLKAGLLIYTDKGAGNAPFEGGILCLALPVRRSVAVVDTHGTQGACDGVLEIDMNAFATGALGGHPLPALLVQGTRIHCQFWGRDTPGNSLLSDALEYGVCP
jgi:hypothetical protein